MTTTRTPGSRAADARWSAVLLAGVVVTASLVTLAIYGARWLVLVRYPWDWSPDEGLTLDYARRVLEEPGRLYPREAVPFPVAYGPLLPLLLAPVVAHWPAPLAAARVMALLWTAGGAAAVYALVRQRGSAPLALASAALHLAPLDLSFWHVLVRVDGLMTALWLAAAIPLLPHRIERGADRLSAARMAAGVTLLLAAILTKPTAVLHGLPLVVGWWFVDRKSALRLASVVAGAGLATLGLLQWSTSGGFLWVNRLWAVHPSVPGQAAYIARLMLEQGWPVLLLGVAGAWRATRRDARPWRDSSLLLVAGGLLIVPTMSKHGAWWNYLVPLLAAIVVFSGRVWSEPDLAPEPGTKPALGGLATAGLALILATTRTFPLPNAEDERTARTLYAFVRTITAKVGGPILVSRPDYAYFDNHQPAEIEGSSFPHLFAARVSGTDRVLERVQRSTYTLVAWTWPLPPEVERAVADGYRHVGGCNLRWYFGALNVHLFARQDLGVRLLPPGGTRCRGAASPVPAP